MPDLSSLDALLDTWRDYLAKHPNPDDFSRESGFVSALTICAETLSDAVERMRKDA